MFFVLTPVFCPHSGRYMQHIREGAPRKNIKAAIALCSKLVRPEQLVAQPYVVDEHNNVVHSEARIA